MMRPNSGEHRRDCREASRCHLGWLPDNVDKDIEYDPVDAGLLGAVGIALEPYCIAQLVERLLGSLCHATLRESGFAQGAEL